MKIYKGIQLCSIWPISKVLNYQGFFMKGKTLVNNDKFREFTFSSKENIKLLLTQLKKYVEYFTYLRLIIRSMNILKIKNKTKYSKT